MNWRNKMKKYELTIVIEVEDDFNIDHLNLLDHGVCDGFEVLLDHEDDGFKLKTFNLVGVKKLMGTTEGDIQEMAKKMDMPELSESQLSGMNRFEAAQALKEGKKLTHIYFSSDEWVMGIDDGYYLLEDGVQCTAAEFWKWRQQEFFNDGWEILNN